MQELIIEKPGVLLSKSISLPRVEKGDALIEVKACGVNRLDLIALRGNTSIPFPHRPGSDVSGVIKKLNGKSNFKIGQPIVVNPAIPCRKCFRCENNLSCSSINIFGYNTPGGYAKYVTVPLEQLYLKPSNLSFAEAASFPLTFLTAWHMLKGRAQIKKGETVFIWGASGGLGSAAVQIAKYFKATVIAAVGSAEDVKKVKKLKADEVVVYTKFDVLKKVNQFTKNRKVDVVFESVGSKTWNTSLSLLAPYGRLVIAGTTSGADVHLNLRNLYKEQFTILGASMGSKEEFEEIIDLFRKKILKTVIAKTFRLNDAEKALTYMEEGKQFGKIVLAI